MSLAFITPHVDDQPSDRDRLAPEILDWLDQHRSVFASRATDGELEKMLVTFFGAATALQALIGPEPLAVLLHAEYAAATHRVARDRQLAQRQ